MAISETKTQLPQIRCLP